MSRFLQEMGQVIAEGFAGWSVSEDGVAQGAFGKYIPKQDQEPLFELFKWFRWAGLDAAEFKFQQYEVVMANPYHGGKVDLKFPDQMVIKGPGYKGIHQVDLVLRSPWVTPVEIVNALKAEK
jgi:hypothetical protein